MRAYGGNAVFALKRSSESIWRIKKSDKFNRWQKKIRKKRAGEATFRDGEWIKMALRFVVFGKSWL